jgi:hypothetical protein
MGIVTADQTLLYASPDQSNPVAPLAHGSILVVIGEQPDWTQTTAGWVRSSDIAEAIQPWIAEVSDSTVAVFAYPNARGGVRRTASQGDLLRVTGVSPGIQGDPNLWWATTEGYVGLQTIRPTDSAFAQHWSLPEADDALNGWWAVVDAAHVRAAPSTDAPVVGEFSGGEHIKVLAEEQGQEVDGNSTWYRIDGGRFAGGHIHSSLVQPLPAPEPTVFAPDRDVGDDPWIVVNRSRSTLTLMRDGEPQFTTYVSLGKTGVDTRAGTYSTFIKYRADRMSSATNPTAEHPYDLPNVPFTQYFRGDGSAIHGTYWHDAFGTRQSQGCINLTWSDSAYLFEQTKPRVPGDLIGLSVGADQATPVVIVN